MKMPDYEDEFEKKKLGELDGLFNEWIEQLSNEWIEDSELIKDVFVSDGFYPGYYKQKPRILFIGREGRGLGGCYSYTDCLFEWYKNGLLNGHELDDNRFHSLICYLTYAIEKYWSGCAFPPWSGIPWASEIGKTIGTPGGISFAFMNLSKISNDSKGFNTDYSVMSRFLTASAKGRFIGREITILDPSLIVTMNFSQYFQIAGIEVINDEIHQVVFDGNHDVCFQFARINGKVFPVLDMWHFSAWTKDMDANYYNPLVSIAEKIDMRKICGGCK